MNQVSLLLSTNSGLSSYAIAREIAEDEMEIDDIAL